MISSSVQASSSTAMDDRFLRAYLRQTSTWSLADSGHMDQHGLSSSGGGDKFLNSSVHFPSEMRSANLHQMVSSIVDESGELPQYEMLPTLVPQQMRSPVWRPPRSNSSVLSESGNPRNIPGRPNASLLLSIRYRHLRDLAEFHADQQHSPTYVQVLLRQHDRMGMQSIVSQVSLQHFRQMIGLQRSAGSLTLYERRNARSSNLCVNQQSVSSSSLPSSSARLTNTFKQQENKTFHQRLMYPQHHSFHEMMSMSDMHSASPMVVPQEMSSYRTNRRTGVANTLHIAIEKCYEQLNYIRDSYAETESKIGIQIVQKSGSTAVESTFLNLSNNPSRVDRLIAEYHHEYNRITRLHGRINESLVIQDSEATSQTLDEWLQAINIVQDRRRQEIDSAAEKCRTGEPRVPDERDVLQLAESLRVLRITTRKIRTVLWYWLYWSVNSATKRIPLVARCDTQAQHGKITGLVQPTSLSKKTSNGRVDHNKENEGHH